MTSWSHYREGRKVVTSNLSARTTSTVVGFFTKNTIFSNHFACDMVYDNKLFRSAEHLYYYLRAVEFSDLSTAEAFRQAANAKIVKELSKEHPLRRFNQVIWHRVRIYKMAITLVTKFSQNSGLRQSLCHTNPHLLVEMSKYDDFWGCGRDVDDIIFDGQIGRGHNVLGKLLTQLREMFLDPDLEEDMIGSCRAHALKTDREWYGIRLVQRTFPGEQLKNIINGIDTPPIVPGVHQTKHVNSQSGPIIRAGVTPLLSRDR